MNTTTETLEILHEIQIQAVAIIEECQLYAPDAFEQLAHAEHLIRELVALHPVPAVLTSAVFYTATVCNDALKAVDIYARDVFQEQMR